MNSRLYSIAVAVSCISCLSLPSFASTYSTKDDLHTQAMSIACNGNVTIGLDESGNATIDPADIISFVTSDCTITDTTHSQTSFDCSDIGTHTIVTTVFDDCGNYIDCVTEVTIVDNSVPVVVCEASHILTLDSMGLGYLHPSSLGFASTDNCQLNFSLDRTVYTCDDVGTFPVILTVDDGHNPPVTCEVMLTVQDLLPPQAVCFEVTIALDETGTASVSENLSDIMLVLFENCNSINFFWDIISFDCSHVGNSWDVNFDFFDDSGNQSSCTATVHVVGADSDEDCDDVSDPCDVCAFGDDKVDYNSDGIPDCSQILGIEEYDPAWKCRNNRILACKLTPGGPQTHCITERKIADFLDDGDYIGPCIECAASVAQAETTHIDFAEPSNDHTTIEVMPNPVSAGTGLTIRHYNAMQLAGIMSILDITGRIIYSDNIPGGSTYNRVNLTLPDVGAGLYFVKISNAAEVQSKVFIVSR